MLDMIFDNIYVVWGQDPLKKQYIENHFAKCGIDNYKFVRSLVPKDFFYDKLGFTFGILAYQKDRFEFDANETLSTVESPWEWGPMILFSIKDPLWNYKKK